VRNRARRPGPRSLRDDATQCYTIHMRRTNLVLDEALLEEATRALGAKTYSGAVNTALQEVIRLRKIQGMEQFFGSGIWEGDLAEMRDDRTPRARSAR